MSRDKSRIVSLKCSHSKRRSAEVLASFHFSLSRCYLSTCGCTNKHVSHSSEHRGRPSNHHRPREAYVHTPTCVIIVMSRVISDRILDRDQGQQIVKSQTSKGKQFSEVACLTIIFFFFSATRWRKSPRKLKVRHARVLRTTLRRKWRSATEIDPFAFYLSFLYSSIVNFLVLSDADQFAVRPHLFCDPFLTQAPYATVCERRLFLSMVLTRTCIFRPFPSDWFPLSEIYLGEKILF